MPFGFNNPLFLLGIAAAAIPVILHLIYRRRAPRVLFSTIRFLRQAAQNTARRKRVENILLLVVRMLLMALLAMALAGPLLKSGAAAGRASLSTVIVVDNSYSMATQHEGFVRLGLAKKVAGQIVDDLVASGDRVTVVFTSGEDAALPASLTDTAGEVRSRLARARAAPRRAVMGAALSRAAEVLETSQTPSNLVVLISDMQALSWKKLPVPDGLKQVRNLSTLIVDTHQDDYRNLGIRDLDLVTVERSVGKELTVKSTIINTSGTPESGVKVHFFIDDQKVETQTVDVGPESTTAVSFRQAFAQPGSHVGRVWLETADSLPTDDAAHFVLDVVPGKRALVVSAVTPGLAGQQDGFYLGFALDPYRAMPASDVPRPVRLQTARPADVAAISDLQSFAAVLVVGPENVDESIRRKLEEYVRAGGGLVVFPSPATTAGEMDDFLAGADPDRRFVPVEAEQVEGDPEGEAIWTIGEVDPTHPVTRAEGESLRSQFDQLEVRRFTRLTTRPPAMVPAGLAPPAGTERPRTPLLAEGPVGRGTVMVVAVPPHLKWSNLALVPLLPIMSTRLVYHLDRKSAPTRNLVPGERFVYELPSGSQKARMTVTGPDGVTTQVDFDSEANLQRAVYDRTEQVGPYQVMVTTDGPDGKPVVRRGHFVVNPDLSESQLQPIEAKAVTDALGALPWVKIVPGDTDITGLLTQVRHGRSLAPVVFIVVLVLAVFECFMANRISLRGAGKSTAGAPSRPDNPS